jgi:hypothetical protein
MSELPTIALLGSVDHEGIVSVLKTSGYFYRKKILESSRSNWASMVGILDDDNVRAVLVKLNVAAYKNIANPSYEAICELLLANIAKKPNIVFIHDALWALNARENSEGRSDPYDGDIPDHLIHGDVPPRVKSFVLTKLREAGLDPICYSTNAQLTVIGSQFVRDLAGHLLFRIYIPHGRLYSTEIDKLLQLFKEFLDNTGRHGITLNKVAADQGTSFEFCGEYPGGSTLTEDFEDFSQFLEMCVSDVDKARTMLSLRDVEGAEASRIISRYTKEARRLFLDITHERELKVLEIRHRLESELSESLPPSTKSETIRAIVDESIPTVSSLTNLLRNGSNNSTSRNLTINLNSQVIDRVNGVVAREISGHVRLGSDADELIKIIALYGGEKAPALISDVHEVGDRGISEGSRVTTKQRLKSFMYGLAPEVAKSGLRLLEEYLKSKIGVSS